MVVALALVAAAWGLLWHWPQQSAQDMKLPAGFDDRDLRHQAEIQQLQNARVATGAQVFLGLGLLVGVYLTYRRIRATEQQAETAQRQEITERFTKAIEQLANEESPSIRLGGIYALEKIVQDEPDAYFSQFREVLSAFVRESAREPHVDETGKPLQLPPPLQVALTVLGRNLPPLTSSDLAIIDWSGAHLEKAHLQGAHLERANLTGTHLSIASLREAHLERATLQGAQLDGAYLSKANLGGARLEGANLRKAHLFRAHLERARLSGTHLEGARLVDAHFEKADLRGAFLCGARLEGADLRTCNLEGADVSDARYDARTRFPGGFRPLTERMIYLADSPPPEDGS